MKFSTRLNGVEPEVVTFSALMSLLGKRSRQSIYDLMRRDPSFPKPRQIGSEFSIGWLRPEVMDWLCSRPLVQLDGLDAVQRRKRMHAKRECTEPIKNDGNDNNTDGNVSDSKSNG